MARMTELPLVLLHAFPLDARMWNAVREPLASHLRVITPDQRGLGRSPLPESDREPSLEDAARDVLALLDRLELDRVVLGGCSMGGYLAMAVLRLAPERVGGLVLIDTKATPDTPEAAQSRLDVAKRVDDEGVHGWLADANLPNLLADSTREERPDVVGNVREIIESQPPAGISWTALALRTRPDSLDLLRESGVPALVVVGEEDPITPLAAANEMVEALDGATLVVLPGAGHLTPLEDPAGVVEAILSWYPATHEK
ncbi:Pimeloyl-ACP methyl ester carboxylesterase [Amycolatopsis pretoriensis]|uniref:Pimeloyl-ACP methyl ester carboxylesterase n=2 Tax=Amycolatopsis pretoriensis TaxID=218821 RepID=A0A1H5QJX9_9PSEU|nr:Pimeloyl-ACP methyl ester carboxylesterase [Amycolatopsis pretoriensis]